MMYQKQKSLGQFMRSHEFLKKIVSTKLIVSVSLFSLFFSHTNFLSFLHYTNFYFSTLPFKLLSHSLDKNCTFLLCNGLLVFLAKYSGLFNSPSSSSHKFSLTDHDHHESFKDYEGHVASSQPPMMNMIIRETTTTTTTTNNEPPLSLEPEAELESTQKSKDSMQQEIESKKSVEAEEETEEKHAGEGKEEGNDQVLEEDNEDTEAESSYCIGEIVEDDDEEEEEEEEGGNGKLSNEELNKKFDDFIRKMKEDLRLEAGQQLIMV